MKKLFWGRVLINGKDTCGVPALFLLELAVEDSKKCMYFVRLTPGSCDTLGIN